MNDVLRQFFSCDIRIVIALALFRLSDGDGLLRAILQAGEAADTVFSNLRFAVGDGDIPFRTQPLALAATDARI